MDTLAHEIETFREKLRAMGCAHYSINGMDEDTSIKRAIAEKWSFFFVCVRDPYHAMKNKSANSIRFRLFPTVKESPSIPMGYTGCPMFAFECFDGEPMKKAISEIKKRVKSEYTYKIEDDLITCYKVVPDTEKRVKVAYLMDAKEGEKAVCYWTSSNRQFRGACEVVRVNAATYRVRLLEAVKQEDGYGGFIEYPVGRELVIPRTKQTQFNCLAVA